MHEALTSNNRVAAIIKYAKESESENNNKNHPFNILSRSLALSLVHGSHANDNCLSLFVLL